MLKLKKIIKWTAILVVSLIAILLSVNGVLSWRAGSRLERRLQAIRDAGDPLTLADLEREPIPPEENAATFLRRADKSVRAIQKEFWAEFYNTESYNRGVFSEENLRSIKTAFDAYPDVISLLRQAANCPNYDLRIDYKVKAGPELLDLSDRQANRNGFDRYTINGVKPLLDLSDCQANRNAIQVLREHVILLAAEGKRDDALEECVVMFRLTRHFDRDPTLVGYLVSMACRGITGDATNRVLLAGAVSAESRAKLETELAQHDAMAGFVESLKSERVFGANRFRAMSGGWKSFFFWQTKNWQANYLDLMAGEIRLGAAPSYKIRAELDALYARSASADVLTAMVETAIKPARGAMDRTRAAMRCLRVLNALQAQAANTGNNKLQSNTLKISDVKLPTEITTDPFTGQPLILRKTSQGFTVYSVGANLKDDGGSFDQQLDTGAGVDLTPEDQ